MSAFKAPRGVCVAACVVMSLVVASGAYASPIDLGTPPGFTDSFGKAVNASGHVVGYAHAPGREGGYDHAFSWTQAGGMIDLSTFGGPESRAYAVNDSGQVVGTAQTGQDRHHGFSWTQAGGLVDLGTLGGPESEAYAINDSGQVVGFAQTSAGENHAFLWTQAKGMVDLGTLGGSSSFATDLNDAGQVAGWSDITGHYPAHAFLWTQAGGMVDLGALAKHELSFAQDINASGQVAGNGGNDEAFSWTQAGGMVGLGTLSRPESGQRSSESALNDSGQVVGESATNERFTPQNEGPGVRVHAFSWTQAVGMVDLGTLGGQDSRASAVNDSGQIVGSAETEESTPFKDHAFFWTQAGGMVDLGTLGGPDSEARAVNESGQVIGAATNAEGHTHAALWPTVPPTVSDVDPDHGLTTGGTPVTITGANFLGSTAVKFGSTNAASFTVNSTTSITAVSPAGKRGRVHITVTTPAGTSAVSSVDVFTFLAKHRHKGRRHEGDRRR